MAVGGESVKAGGRMAAEEEGMNILATEMSPRVL